MQMTLERDTKYTKAVRGALASIGHGTNAELLHILQRDYPKLSATTVHRVTARLLERGDIAKAPTGNANAVRFDNNTEMHDHFFCTSCDVVYDTEFSSAIRRQIEEQIGESCSISGSLVVSGICKYCSVNKESI